MEIESHVERGLFWLACLGIAAAVALLLALTYQRAPALPAVRAELAVLVAWTVGLPLVLAWQTNRAFRRLVQSRPAVEPSILRTLGRARYWPLVIGLMGLGLAIRLLGQLTG